ncbi:cytochrome b/b6 domain-containing protein [Luteimonas sp. Y-2-2-4F]|nr:cytochrome b/b6 domain-containing protein [Luteimonas sp. Y-2-2-4F]MCD9030798.1 cytochrome b/b6 domain-containing protein [Luteimonas sp. Y-2-2-4F]
MTWRNTPARWGAVSQSLHWLVVAVILFQGASALWMVGLPNSPSKISLYALHKSLGLSLLALAALRLGWRLHAGAPAALPGPRWQHAAATASHVLLYALLLAVPLSGWLFNSAAGFPLQWFGLVNLPALAAPDPDLRALARNAHEWLFWLLVLVALVHAAAALWHHLFLGDATLARMLPRGWVRSGSDAPPPEDPRHA